MTTWRWDQGRRDYFRFERIQEIATALAPLDGVSLSGDPLREPLQSASGLDFPPPNYTVWRNFGRIFKTSLLAVDDGGRLHVTQVCIALASRTLGREDYLTLVLRRLYMPWPAFSDDLATSAGQLVFPAAAVLRLLLARLDGGVEPSATLDEIGTLLIANRVTGLEPIADYLHLTPTHRPLQGDERRQVRELLQFFSQVSILDWEEDRIRLVLVRGDEESRRYAEFLADPEVAEPLPDRTAELLRLGRLGIYGEMPRPPIISTPAVAAGTRTRREGGTPNAELGEYVAPSEDVRSRARLPFSVDLDAVDRGNSAHRRTQNAMKDWAERQGYRVARVRSGPSPDLLFETPDGWCVVEVKSLTDANEPQQVRLAIGQVLDYCFDLRRALGAEMAPAIALEREPNNRKWVDLCQEAGIWLTWAPDFPGAPSRRA